MDDISYRRTSSVESVDNQWKHALDFIQDLFIEENKSGAVVVRNQTYQDITKTHWKRNTTNCSKETCSKLFNLFERPHHCRRCGNIFCGACLSYEKRLNLLARPDRGGRLYKVCLECFDEGPQVFGQSRDWKDMFCQMRWFKGTGGNRLIHSDKIQLRMKVNISNFRDLMSLDKECQRLEDGFRESLSIGLMGKVLHDFGVKEHVWKRSTFWVYANMATRCYQCDTEFGLISTRNNCVVCGSVVCNKCSSEDLIVFIADSVDVKDSQTRAQLAIIRIVGCPAIEPIRCMYLRICTTCNAHIQDRQMAAHVKETKQNLPEEVSEEDVAMSRIIKVYDRRLELRAKIDDDLSNYKELVEALDNRSTNRIDTKRKSNMQSLAKAQGDLSNCLADLLTTILSIKHIRPITKAQLSIFKNILLSSSDYYHENRYLFHELQRRMETLTPKEVLAAIQAEVDKNAINSCYLSIKQLIFELILLNGKHRVHVEPLQSYLVSLEEVAESDLKSSLPSDAWSDHKLQIDEFLQDQLTTHRLIRPSLRLTSKLGARHIVAVILERTEFIVQQLLLQLNAKCAHARFRSTKDALTRLLNEGMRESIELMSETMNIPVVK